MTEDKIGEFIDVVRIEDVNSEDHENTDDITIEMFENAINLIITNHGHECSVGHLSMDKGTVKWLTDTLQDWLEGK